MPELVRLYEMDFGTPLRDAAFLNDEHVVFTIPAGDTMVAGVGPGRQPARVLVPWSEVHPLVAWAIGAKEIDPKPPQGNSPRVAVSAHAGLLVLNPYDLVILTLPLDGSRGLEINIEGWGQYDPAFRFSADGAWLATQGDHLYLTDTRTRRTVEHRIGASDWHPAENRLLALDFDDRLCWIDADPARVVPLGPIELEIPRYDAAGIVVGADAEECVIAFYADRLEWWGLDPLKLIEVRATVNEGEPLDGIDHVVRSPDRRLLGAMSARGLRLWDLRTRRPLGEVPGAKVAAFSPSGRRIVVLTDPYPNDPRRTDWMATLWEVRGTVDG